MQKALHQLEKVSQTRLKSRALRKLSAFNRKPIGAAQLIHAIEKIKLTNYRQFILRLKEES